MPKLEHAFRAVVGDMLADCRFLADRWDGKFEWDEQYAETWVGRVDPLGLHAIHGQKGWIKYLWQSPGGTTFVTQGDLYENAVHVSSSPDPLHPIWRTYPLPCSVGGVWGLDDQHVFAWGLLPDDPHLYSWTGAGWAAMACPGRVLQMHGIAPDLLYAVGSAGLIARWDGSRWINTPSRTPALVNGIYVVSADEMYACTASGTVLEGSVYGWSEVVAGELPFTSVVKFGDSVLLGSRFDGLRRLHGNALTPVDPDLKACQMHVGKSLLLACDDRLVESRDGETISASVPLSDFVGAISHVPIMW